MLLLILACLLGVAVVPVIYLFAKVLRGKKNLEFYQQQGIPTLYSVTKGHMLIEDRELPENSKNSNLEFTKTLINRPDCKAAGAFALNSIMQAQSVVHLHSSDLIREYLLKEDQFDKQAVFPQLPNFLGLFFFNGEKAFSAKALFSKIFNPEGMEAFTPKICTLVNSIFSEFCKKHDIQQSKPARVSLNELFDAVMIGIANTFIFGLDQVKTGEEIDELPGLLEKLIHNFMTLRRNPWTSVLPFSVAGFLGLAPQVKAIQDCFQRQKQILQRYIDKRSASSHLGESVIDRTIAHNRECLKGGNSKDLITIDEIVGNYNIFFFAGTDTSQSTTKATICHMADKDHLKNQIDSINKQIYDSEGFTTTQTLEACPELSLWVKECLRMHTPLARTTLKRALKDVRLGKYTIRRGDFVIMALTGMHNDREFFQEADTFDPNRFSSDKEKMLPKYQYIPFSLGKRVCLGRHLGELMVKLLVTKFIQFFEYEKPVDVDYYTAVAVTNAVLNPYVEVRLKSAV